MDFDPSKDYYKSLGVSESASQDEIKKAFKKLAVQHQPHKGGEKAKFQEINEAYQVIGDKEKEENKITLESRSGEKFNLSLEELIEKLEKEVEEKK